MPIALGNIQYICYTICFYRKQYFFSKNIMWKDIGLPLNATAEKGGIAAANLVDDNAAQRENKIEKTEFM